MIKLGKTNFLITNFIGMSAPIVAGIYVSRKNGFTNMEITLTMLEGGPGMALDWHFQ